MKIELIVALVAVVIALGSWFAPHEANLGGVTNYNSLGLAGDAGVVNVLNVGSTTAPTTAESSLDSAATTTLLITSSVTTKGGCIQFEAPGGSTFFFYATSATPVYWNAGTCK